MNDISNDNLPELLVLLIQNFKGDPFAKLIDISTPITRSLTNKYFFASYEREDILQEAHKILAKAADTYEIQNKLPFLQYYHMMLSNHFNRLVKAEEAHKRKINVDLLSLDHLIEDGGIHTQGSAPLHLNPEDMAITREMFASYLIELSTFEEDAFLLFLKGYTSKEVAVELDYKEEQVKNALYRCSVKLKKALS